MQLRSEVVGALTVVALGAAIDSALSAEDREMHKRLAECLAAATREQAGQ